MPAESRLSPTERLELLQIARAAIERKLCVQLRDVEPTITRCGGAFVTVKTAGDLRGCIGWLEVGEPLTAVIAHCAVAASSEDPRFPPLTAGELHQLRIEISVLGVLEAVTDVTAIEVGVHGLVVEEGLRRGLLLPQVATEHNWDRETFLRCTCLKAGLHSDAWRNSARIYRFEAEVFGEEEPV